MKRNKLLFLPCILILSLVLLVACGNTLNNEKSADSLEKSQAENKSSVNAPAGEDDNSDNEVLPFQGESDNWKITFTKFKGPLAATTTSEAGSKDNRAYYAYIKYIGDNKPPKQIDYEFEDDSGKVFGTEVTLEDGVLDANMGDYGMDPSKESIIKSLIKWNGKTETIDLNYE